MSDRVERNISTIHRWIEIGRNQGDSSLVDEVWAEDLVFRQVPERELHGREAYREFYESAKAAGTGTFSVDDAFGQGDWVATRCTWSLTLAGEHRGVDRAGFTIGSTAVVLWRFDNDGKVVEVWDYTDLLTPMRQLGTLPSPSAAAS